MKNRWISYDPDTREKNVDRQAIADDVKFLIYQGKDEGIRRMMVRDMQMKDASGNPIDWKKGDLDTLLTDEQKLLLTKSTEQYGDEYQKKFDDRLLHGT